MSARLYALERRLADIEARLDALETTPADRAQAGIEAMAARLSAKESKAAEYGAARSLLTAVE